MKPHSPNRIEKQLRSWKPRPPSASLEGRIFGRPGQRPAPPQAQRALEWFQHGTASGHPGAWAWMTPALAVFLLGLFIAGPQRPPGFSALSGSDRDKLVAIEGDEGGTTRLRCLMAEVHSPHNYLVRATFEWTNREASLTTTGLARGTNSLFY